MKNSKFMVFGKKKAPAGAVLLSVILLVMAWFTLHDMQQSEGIGLYYAASTGAGIGDTGMGLAAECAGMLAMLAFLLFPCIVCKRLKPDSFLRILIAYLAFMPVTSMASLVHLLDGTTEMKYSEALLAGNLGQAFREGASDMISLLTAGIPLLLLLAALTAEEKAGEEAGRQNSILIFSETSKKRKAAVWIPAAEILLLAAAILFPALKDVCNYFFRYILLVCGFSLWERLFEYRPRYRNRSWLVFAIMGLRGIYIMAEVKSIYHI